MCHKLCHERESLVQLEPEPAEDLAARADAADRVVRQTGCISHGGYWRENEQCKRSGKACVMDGAAVAILR